MVPLVFMCLVVEMPVSSLALLSSYCLFISPLTYDSSFYMSIELDVWANIRGLPEILAYILRAWEIMICARLVAPSLMPDLNA